MDTGYVQLLDADTRTACSKSPARARGAAGFVAGAFVADEPGAAFDLDAYLARDGADHAHGGTPVVFPSCGLNALDDEEWVAAHEALGARSTGSSASSSARCSCRTAGSTRSPRTKGLLGVASCIGAKHSSLSRAAEWDRLAVRDRVRPEFHVFTGNDLAIDMVCYGSDYLLGLSAFAPEAFAERDRRWAAR